MPTWRSNGSRPSPKRVPVAEHIWNIVILALLAQLAALAWGGPAHGSAVILLYHHISRDAPASTSITPALFEAHLDHLEKHGYQVLPLSRIMTSIQTGSPLPPGTVAITFDDAYASVYASAAPLLAARGLPYAVFVSTDYLDGGFGGYMTWAQLRALEKSGAEVGNHSRHHDHYVHRLAGEDEASWRARITRDIQWAQRRLAEELKNPLRAFAYPFGEFDGASVDLVTGMGLVGFGQQSGPVDHRSDRGALPRFPMAGSYAALESLEEKLNTRPLHVIVLTPQARVLPPPILEPGVPQAAAGAPILRLQLDTEELTGPAAEATLRCYVTGQPPASVRWLDSKEGIFEVEARHPLPVGRSKYTCTAPVPGMPGSFYWYSHLWMKPPAPGRWYDG